MRATLHEEPMREAGFDAHHLPVPEEGALVVLSLGLVGRLSRNED